MPILESSHPCNDDLPFFTIICKTEVTMCWLLSRSTVRKSRIDPVALDEPFFCIGRVLGYDRLSRQTCTRAQGGLMNCSFTMIFGVRISQFVLCPMWGREVLVMLLRRIERCSVRSTRSLLLVELLYRLKRLMMSTKVTEALEVCC